MRTTVASSLRFLAKHGRVVVADSPTLALKKFDWLVPSPELLHVGRFEEVPLGVTVTSFWRPTLAGRTRTDPVAHRNPFSPQLHTSPGTTIAIDVLHAFYYVPACGGCRQHCVGLSTRPPGESTETLTRRQR